MAKSSNVPAAVTELPRTKLVATLGPACQSPEMLRALIQAGVDVFRLNMAHAKIEIHQASVTAIREAARDMGRPVGILVDLAGPKIRLGNLVQEPLSLELGQRYRFIRGDQAQAADEFTCGYPRLLDELQVGHDVVLADGIARLRVIEKSPDEAVCEVIEAGTIRSRQGINLPGTSLSISAFGEIDRGNAVWAARAGVDFVSLSFVRNADEIRELKELLVNEGSRALAIAKIEKREALEQLDSIVAAADGVMVARGDLGVEIDIEKTPLAQKRIVRTCLQLGKPVIVATQMLESMHHSRQPTRAEVSDVANAILDGADACMLSGETAIGDFPLESAKMMKKIMRETEQMLRYRSSRMSSRDSDVGWDILDSVMLGAGQIARRLDARFVVIVSSHSRTALIKSKQRDFVPTVCLSNEQGAAQRMALYWGIVPIVVAESLAMQSDPSLVVTWAKAHLGLSRGDKLVLVLDHEKIPGIHDTIAIAEIV